MMDMPRKGWSNRKFTAFSITLLLLGASLGIGVYHFVITSGELSWFFGGGSQPAWRGSVQKWLENAGGTLVNLAAVRSGPEPSGVICTLAIKVTPGDGYVYVSVDPMLVGFDFQDADRKAIKVACGETGFSLDDDGVGIAGHDVSLMVLAPSGEEVEVQAIDGPSAGAATTIAMIAILENKRVKHDYIITGTIREDGSIGLVGGIFYKAKAAKKAGVSHFLVPPGQSEVTMYRKVVRQVGPFEWTSYEPFRVDLNEYAEEHNWGLEILEVATIEEAKEIMLK